jgi:hypothetical protein
MQPVFHHTRGNHNLNPYFFTRLRIRLDFIFSFITFLEISVSTNNAQSSPPLVANYQD